MLAAAILQWTGFSLRLQNCGHKLYQCFLSSMSQGNRNKNENKQMGPIQTCKLLYSKGNYKWNENATQRLRAILASDTTDKGLVYK